jgi:hypothetical protein
VQPLLSVAVIVNEELPWAVGVPESTPDTESDNPAGRVPDVTANVTGAAPPVAVMVWLYADPTVPGVSDESVIVGHPMLME